MWLFCTVMDWYLDQAGLQIDFHGGNHYFSSPFRTYFIVKSCVGPSRASETALSRRGMVSTDPLKVCWGIWHQDIRSRSFKSCKLRGQIGLIMDQTLCSEHSRDALGKSGGQDTTMTSWSWPSAMF